MGWMDEEEIKKIDNSPVFVKTYCAVTQKNMAFNVNDIVSYIDVSSPGSYYAVEVKLKDGAKYLVCEIYDDFDHKVNEALAAVRREIIEKRM